MAEQHSESPVAFARRAVRDGWRTARTVYYANTLSWRVLKSGALLFLGFFLWAGSNVLLSYRAGWDWLYYPMAYGFLVVWYGPVHHAVVIPLSLRLRKRADDWSRVGRRLPTAMLAVFLVAVVVLGTYPVGGMAFEFAAGGGGSADVNPDLLCTKSTGENGTVVHCHLQGEGGYDRVVVRSGGRQLAVDEEAPYEFTVRASEMTEVAGQTQFQVVLQDEDGNTVRRYSRTVAMVPEG